MMSQLPRLNVVLKSPVIPWNTGNAGRTCLGFGAALHLVGPLGFDPSHQQAKRAGLDYWPSVNLHLWENWEEFEATVLPELNGNGYLFSKQDKHGENSLNKVDFFEDPSNCEEKVALIFGSEQKGLDGLSASALKLPRVYFPMNSDIRSYNLSSSVAMGLSEAWRQTQTRASTTCSVRSQQQQTNSAYSWQPPPLATNVDVESLPLPLRHTYIPLVFDTSADNMLKKHACRGVFFRNMGAFFATTLCQWTHSDAAAFFKSRDMFALSSSATRTLLCNNSLSLDRLPKLLDVGAATGTTTAEMSECFDYVVATEASKVCTRTLAQVDGVDVAMTAKSLQNTKEFGPFDVVSLLNVLDRTEDPDALLSEAISVLKEGSALDGDGDGGVLLLGFSMPLSPFVQPQTFTTSPQLPDQKDALDNDHLGTFFSKIDSEGSFETFVSDIHKYILLRRSLTIERWSKFPYVAGSPGSYQWMEQVLFVVRPQMTSKTK